jgi:hypothetical protein
MRTPASITWYRNELAFIQTAWPEHAQSFSYDRALFELYVRMQARFAREDGFESIADDMERAI